ncbi:MAG: hypothetical protein JW910_18945 [Anaerolineae bacterium]|nr:hypothetical protein [Anaerolineae bacterium]
MCSRGLESPALAALLLFALLFTVTFARAQGAPTQTFSSAASRVSFRYPAGWVAQERFSGWIDIATRESAIDPGQPIRSGDVWIILYTAPFTVDMAGYYLPSETDPVVALTAYLQALGADVIGAVASPITIGGASAARADFTGQLGAAAAIAAPVQASGGPDVFAILLVQANNPLALAEVMPIVTAIAETLVTPDTTPPPGAFPTPVVLAPPTATPPPSLTPVPTHTSTATFTDTATATATATFTLTPSATPTATFTATQTPLISLTPSTTTTPSQTFTPTDTLVPSLTPSPTLTLTVTPSPVPSLTPSPTLTLTVTPSPVPSLTPSPTFTLTPTATPSPFPPEPGALLVNLAAVELGAVYTAPEGVLSLRHPAGWTVEERALGGWQVEGPGVRAALLPDTLLLPELPPGVVLVSPRDALALYTARSRTQTVYREPVALDAGGRAALRAENADGSGGLLILARGEGDFVFLFVLEAQGGLPAVEAPLLAIASTVVTGP